jgi:hypothetical protein
MRSDKVDWRPLIGADAARAGSAEALELRRVKCNASEPLLKRLLRKLFPDERKQERVLVPPLVGYLGSVRSSKPYEVGDISLSGFSLLTEERWSPGTEMPITLEKTADGDIAPEYFTVQATVVRCGDDGVGFSILLSEEESKAAYGNPLKVRWVSKPEMKQFLNRIKGEEDLAIAAGEGAKPLEGTLAAAHAGSMFDVGRQTAITQTGSD